MALRNAARLGPPSYVEFGPQSCSEDQLASSGKPAAVLFIHKYFLDNVIIIIAVIIFVHFRPKCKIFTSLHCQLQLIAVPPRLASQRVSFGQLR